ncbi:site-specific DNA-methyltransferase [Streptomyces sp. SAS_270]|uniref:site-specific DNA-methyltransferase n=1 Tax=Streptomyces sp. SAS_270 TaxID=3412748 RepID=UPI00403C99D2
MKSPIRHESSKRSPRPRRRSKAGEGAAMQSRKDDVAGISNPVTAITHTETRSNIPTADNSIFLDEADTAPRNVPVQRSAETRSETTVTEPELTWRGKREQDAAGLVVDAPPLFIQEKIDSRALVAALRSGHVGNFEQPSLYDEFDGLDDWANVEFYQHEQNWSNRLILGDSLAVMASLAEREKSTIRGKVQMIYVDPPYGIRFGSNWQPRTRSRDVSDTKAADVTREVEQIKAFRDTWQWGLNSFLAYLRDRLALARELLNETGSVFVQIGDDNLHLVRSVLDEVFDRANFCSQISFRTTSSATGDLLAGTTDYLLWYAKDREALKSSDKYRQLYRAKVAGGDGVSAYRYVELPDGARRAMKSEERRDHTLLPKGSKVYTLDNLTSQASGREKGEGAASWFKVELEGRIFQPPQHSRWKTNPLGMERLKAARRLGIAGNTLRYIRYLDDFPAFPLSNSWDDTTTAGFGDPKLYVVQTNTKVVERCMLMTTDPGDLVLDPTCGSGTTAYVAEQWGRRWISIDTSRVALALARQRLMAAKYPYYLLADSPVGRAKEAAATGQPLSEGTAAGDVRKGFVYERIPHIELRTYSTNPAIHSDMSRQEIDTVIRRHAKQETLYDQPFKDLKKVRVTGPFTVESLSPYRTLSADAELSGTERAADDEADASSYVQTILEHLLKEGVGTGEPSKRITFDTLTPYPDAWIQGEGHREGGPKGTPQRIAVFIGPQYGTVGPSQIKSAARQARRGEGFDLLVVCAFAFTPDAQRTAAEFQIGSLRVLNVRMNSDLAMGRTLLKNTGSGNLFTLFGEPDIEILHTDDNRLTATVRGVDVYDPTTGAIRSKNADGIALWMIDTEYNEESFFVRHCYFTGDKTAYKALSRALRAQIDESAWQSCYQTTSRPFAVPGSGKIAVKVINDYGDEVLKVYDVTRSEQRGAPR